MLNIRVNSLKLSFKRYEQLLAFYAMAFKWIMNYHIIIHRIVVINVAGELHDRRDPWDHGQKEEHS